LQHDVQTSVIAYCELCLVHWCRWSPSALRRWWWWLNDWHWILSACR